MTYSQEQAKEILQRILNGDSLNEPDFEYSPILAMLTIMSLYEYVEKYQEQITFLTGELQELEERLP